MHREVRRVEAKEAACQARMQAYADVCRRMLTYGDVCIEKSGESRQRKLLAKLASLSHDITYAPYVSIREHT